MSQLLIDCELHITIENWEWFNSEDEAVLNQKLCSFSKN